MARTGHKNRKIGVSHHAALLIGLWASAVVAAAEPSALVSLDIPAESLQSALVEFAAQAKVSVKFEASQLVGKQSPGIHGQYVPADGLKALLQGSGLDAQGNTAGDFVLVPVKPTASVPDASTSSTPVLPAINVSDSAATQAQTGFAATNTSSATRTDTPISELPQSVQVITQDVMKSQQATTAVDVLSNVSGISVIVNDGISPTVLIRGFSAPVATDGLVNSANNFSTEGLNIPLIGVDHIDVVKGADSILSGDMEPGGVVNVVRKRPQAESQQEVMVQTGSYGEALLGIDLTGAISSANHINYRFIAQGERSGNGFGPMDGSHSYYIAPSIGYKTESTDFVVGFEQRSYRGSILPYTFTVNGTPYGNLFEASRLSQKDDHSLGNSTTAYYDLQQKITPQWTFRSKAAYGAVSYSFRGYQAASSDTVGGYYEYPYRINNLFYTWSLEESAQGKFSTGPLFHTLVAGFSYQRGQERAGQSASYAELVEGDLLTGTQPDLAALSGTARQLNIATSYTDQFYLHDQIAIGDRLHLLGSIAHSREWINQTRYSSTTPEGAWTPNFGVLYQLTGEIGVYASYLRSFTNQGETQLADGTFAPPALGKTVEVGAKGNFFNDRLTSSIALFRTAQTNYLSYDALGLAYLDAAGIASRGVEVDMSGQILPGWKVIANYTYANTQTNSDNSTYFSLPKDKARLWTTYEMQGGPLRGLGFGAGMTVRSSYKFTDVDGSTAHVPGQASFDASVYYRAKSWAATFGVKDLTNRLIYGDGASYYDVPIQSLGRTFLLTVTHDF